MFSILTSSVLCAALLSVVNSTPLAAAVTCPKGKKAFTTTETINFDNIATLPAGTGTQVPVGYASLDFQSWYSVNHSLTLAGLAPHSSPNTISTNYVAQTTNGQSLISVLYTGSNVYAFDVKSLWYGCTLSTEIGAVAPAQGCLVAVTGYTGTDNAFSNSEYACSFTRLYNPGSLLNIHQLSYSGAFPSTCKNLTSLVFQFTIQPATLAASQVDLGLQIDDVEVVLYGCK